MEGVVGIKKKKKKWGGFWKVTEIGLGHEERRCSSQGLRKNLYYFFRRLNMLGAAG